MATQATICSGYVIPNAASCEAASKIRGVSSVDGEEKWFDNGISHKRYKSTTAQQDQPLSEYVSKILNPQQMIDDVGSCISYDQSTGAISVAHDCLLTINASVSFWRAALDTRNQDNLAGTFTICISDGIPTWAGGSGSAIMCQSDSSPTVYEDVTGGNNPNNANLPESGSGPSVSVTFIAKSSQAYYVLCTHSFFTSQIHVGGFSISMSVMKIA